MMCTIAAAAVLFFVGGAFAADGSTYYYTPASYADSNQWGSSCPTGTAQSPINIYSGDVSVDTNLANDAFVFNDYDVNVSGVKLKNVGHSVNVDYAAATAKPTVRGGGLGAEYTAAQFHFHWGSTNSQGSEHMINSKQSVMEMHIVHYKSEYGSLGGAVPNADGLAVLGFMFEVSSATNSNMGDIVSNLPSVKDYESNAMGVELSPFMLNNILPTGFNANDYFRYQGSLTTPGCNEVVTWTLFKDTIKISQEQLDEFRQVMDSNVNSMSNNYRPVQAWNGREIKASVDPDLHWGYTATAKPGGAEQWPMYYSACAGQSQSPIDIPKFEVTTNSAGVPWVFTGYGSTTGVGMTVTNNGHVAQVDIAGGTLTVSGGGLTEPYHALQMHFHWGSTDMKGSEHKMNGKAYPMELHIVNKMVSKTVNEALAASDGLAVLGFFFEVQSADNAALAPIISKLSSIQNKGDSVSMDTITLDSFLPAESYRKHYFRYSGSLTTPTCNEVVVWSVFGKTIKISAAQLGAFRTLLSGERNTADNAYVRMVDNYRPVQSLNTRQVTAFVPKWEYAETNGYHAQNWGKYYPYCDDDTPRGNALPRQSPINIDLTSVTYSMEIKNLMWVNYDAEDIVMTLENNGHAAQVNIPNAVNAPKISGGGLGDEFIAAQFHFHWGSSDARGSEHLIDDAAYPMEMHIVHYNKKYGSLGASVTQADGLAVLGFMFEISGTDNNNLTYITGKLQDIVQPKTSPPVDLSKFSVNSLLSGIDTKDYFRYDGSLTTPGCYESVKWTVFKNPIPISTAQMALFRDLKSSEKNANNAYIQLVDNFRPPMQRHNRQVKATFFVGSATNTNIMDILNRKKTRSIHE